MSTAPAVAPPDLRRWQVITVSLIFAGYAGYYLCRSDFSVALPLLVNELAAHGMSRATAQVSLGLIASFGVMAYALGNIPAGLLADRAGGRRNFLGGMAGSIVFTLLFAAAGGLPLFTIAWIGNRLVQSLGPSGLVKITSRWFSGRSYGTVMAVVSLSFLFGDAAARAFLGALLGNGVGRRGLFAIAAAGLALLLVANLAFLRESPVERGMAEPDGTGVNLGRQTPASGIFRNRLFWLVCTLSVGMTALREAFNTWTPTYFTQAAGLTPSAAAYRSALFPLLGGVSTLLLGILSDRYGKRGRAAMIAIGMLLAALLLPALALTIYPTLLIAAIGFVIIGPYTLIAGAVALDLGGKHAGGAAAGILDGVGYLGPVAADPAVALISVHWGWRGVFFALAGVALVTCLVAVAYFRGLRSQRL